MDIGGGRQRQLDALLPRKGARATEGQDARREGEASWVWMHVESYSSRIGIREGPTLPPHTGGEMFQG